MSSLLLQLKPENALVHEHIVNTLSLPVEERGSMDVRLGDFDGYYWRVEVVEGSATHVYVCLECPCYAQLQSLGLDAYLTGVYGSLMVAPRQGASVSLAINGDALPGTLVEVATRVSQLRMHVSSFPFLAAMNAVAGGRGGSEPPYALRARPREAVYVLTRGDRVLVVYHLDVAEPTDRAIARVVAQELTEAYRTVNSAPPVSWSEREPPGELKGFPDLPPPSENSIGYLTFTIFPAPYKSEAQRLGVASQLSLFRSFLQYHLKAAKTYLHARMRSRAEGSQKILNRAIPEDPFASTDKKLASGKTFVQQSAAKQ